MLRYVHDIESFFDEFANRIIASYRQMVTERTKMERVACQFAQIVFTELVLRPKTVNVMLAMMVQHVMRVSDCGLFWCSLLSLHKNRLFQNVHLVFGVKNV